MPSARCASPRGALFLDRSTSRPLDELLRLGREGLKLRISWSRTLDGGGLVVSDEVAVTIGIELVSAPPSSKQIAPAARLRSRPSRVYSGLHPAQPGLPSLSGIGNGMAGSLEDSG